MAMTVVLAVLLGWYFVYEKSLKKKQTESEEKTKQLVLLEKDQIQELILQKKTSGDGKEPWDTFRLKKAGTDWNLTEPLQDQADSSAVNSMLSTLTSTKQERVVDGTPKDLDAYGLKTPFLKIAVKKDSNAAAEEIWIGSDTPVGYSTYAKTASQEPVYRISRGLKTGFDKTLKDLRNKNIVSFGRFDIAEVEIQNLKENFTLKKGDKDEWQLTRENLPASSTEVNKTLNAIVELKAKEFASESDTTLKDFGLNPPAAKISVTQQKDKTRTGIWVGKVKDKVYAKREDKKLVYEVDKDILEKVERPSKEYRNMELANFNRFDIKRIKLERGKEILELLKEDSGWAVPTEPQIKIDENKVDGLLTKIQDTKIQQYLSGKTVGMKDPPLTIRLFEKKDNTENEKLVFNFGKASAVQVTVERSGLQIPFAIGVEDFKRINLTKQDFVKKEEPAKKEEPTAKQEGEKKS